LPIQNFLFSIPVRIHSKFSIPKYLLPIADPVHNRRIRFYSGLKILLKTDETTAAVSARSFEKTKNAEIFNIPAPLLILMIAHAKNNVNRFLYVKNKFFQKVFGKW
jgi:hypothetical protein